MVSVINMEDLRYLKLFKDITGINTRFCFEYNNNLIFCVPRWLAYRAIGENGKNAKKISEIVKKRVKIIANPEGISDLKKFVESIVSPSTFKSIEIIGEEIVITAGNRTNKAMLIGRNKKRFSEMQGIMRDFFKKELVIA